MFIFSFLILTSAQTDQKAMINNYIIIKTMRIISVIFTVTLSHCGLDQTVKEKCLPELQCIFSSRVTDVSHTVEQTQKTLQALENHLKKTQKHNIWFLELSEENVKDAW